MARAACTSPRATSQASFGITSIYIRASSGFKPSDFAKEIVLRWHHGSALWKAFTAVLLSLFAGIGVLLAGIGIYGVVAFLVAQQTREIGIRIALGATPQKILKMVLSNMARWTVAGAMLGLLGAWLCSRLLESLLFEVKPHDPFLLSLALLFLIVAVIVAAWIPARRAMRVDPMVALRYE